jgi:hypothetical protein
MDIQEKYTVTEATAFLGFKSRSTINARTTEQGNNAISFDYDDEGNKIISAVELQRVFPEKFKKALERAKNTPHTPHAHSAIAQSNTVKNTGDTGRFQLLQEQLDYERAERLRERQEAQERERKAEAREESARAMIERLTETISKQTLLLEHHQLKKSVAPRFRWFRSLSGKSGQ